MVYRQREEHNEDTNSGPHYFEKLDALSLHLFMSSLHAQVLESSALHIHFTVTDRHIAWLPAQLLVALPWHHLGTSHGIDLLLTWLRLSVLIVIHH